jgi:RHS repeat-associated protein
VSLAAWGDNSYGQLGNGTTSGSTTPVAVAGALTGVTTIAGGLSFGYALRNDGTVWAWGDNSDGELGNGTTTSSTVPVPVTGLSNVTAIAAAGNDGYALRSDGTVWSWGLNRYSELGNGTTTSSTVPVPVTGLSNVTAIAAGGYNASALRSDGTVWSWGFNGDGELGNGSTANSSVPVRVSGLTGAFAVARGSQMGYALRSDGTVWAWGDNFYGELGNASTASSTTPVQVSGLSGVRTIAGGSTDGYALRSDGTVWAWGNNSAGSLGNGSTANSSVPVRVSGLTAATAIAGGYNTGFAVRSDGTVRAWGRNSDGELGNGTTTGSALPVQVSGLTGATTIASGFYAAYALTGGPIPVSGPVSARELSSLGNPCLPCAAARAAVGTGGDPVDTSSGAFSESFTDLAITGRGPQAVWERTYSSIMAGDDGPLGYGWHTGYTAHLVIDAASGNVRVSQENGAEVVFTNKAGALTAPQRVQATLTKNADGSYTFVRRTAQTLRFSATGALLSMADRNGETTSLSYTGGKLSKITEPAGRVLSVTYTGTHITRVSDPMNHAVTYGYDAAGNLTSISAPDGAVTTYGYDSAHHFTSVLDPQQQGSSSKHPLTMVYDARGRVTKQTDPLGRATTFAYAGDPFSSSGGTTVVTDPAGHQQEDVYQNGLRTTTVRGFGSAAATTATFTYDPATLGVTSTTITAPGDPNTHRSTATYDAQGHPTSQVDASGRQVDTTYNSFGEPLTITAPNPSTVGPPRVTTAYAYDGNGNLLTETMPLYTSATAHTNQTTTYQRTNATHRGDVTGVVDPLGNTTQKAYDTAGNVAAVTTPQGRKTTYTYDAVGRRLTAVAPAGNVAGADASAFTTSFAYDNTGRLLSTSGAAPGAPLVTSQTYDLDGRTTTRTDPLGRTTANAYDLAGELTQVTRPDGSTTKTAYWPDGVVKSQTDGNGNAVGSVEDPLGRIASVTDPLGRITAYTYDAADAVLTVTDPQKQVTTHTYDPSGALLTTKYSDGSTPTVTRTYNAAGLPATLADATGTTTFGYDSLSRLTAQASPAGTVGYGHNLNNQVTSLTYPDGRTVARGYEADGAMISVTDWIGGTTTFSYDANEQLVGATAPNGVSTTIGRDNPGRITGTTFASGPTVLGSLTYDRNAAGQITAETSVGLGPSRTFTYDPAGRVTAENNLGYGYDKADDLTVNAGTTQTYDAARQLATTDSGGALTSYRFDPRGNRIQATTGSATTGYSYDQANRLTRYTAGTVTAAYLYNGDGLRVAKTAGGTTRAFVYDTAEGLPVVLTDGTASYVYGPGGTPIEQVTIADATVTYLHSDQLGSVRLLTNAAGGIAGTVSYTAYGTRTATGTASPLGFAGQYTDTETGLVYLRARYYDPATGGFLTADPALQKTGIPYSYANDDPVTGSDPTGLCAFLCKVAIGIGIGIVAAGVVACAIAEPCGAIAAGAVAGLAGEGAGGLAVAVAAGGGTAVSAGEIVAGGAALGGLGGTIWAASSSGTDSAGCDDTGGTPTDRYKEHLTDRDLDAARRELNGEVVARKADGTPWDHVHEVRDAQNGLLNRINQINRRLGWPGLSSAERASLEGELGEASRMLDYSEQFVPR